DKIGFLADVYRFADLAFIGGSFKDKVHSVMEPLCCGLNVITGPFYKNSPEAVKYHNRFVHSVQSNSEFNKQVKKLINGEKVNILAEMKKNLNASQKVISIIQDLKAKT
ncbi:MAG: 3-deoxy-D-manno-octulosonic acid transferase, partial [Pseudobdellovibrio sp.]